MELTTKQRIIDVLVSNKEQYLRSDQIAQIAYSNAYIKETKATLDAKIARNINSAISYAMEQDIIVISKRLPRTDAEKKEAKRKNVTNHVSDLHPQKSYKVATEKDSGDVADSLQKNEASIKNYISKRNLIVDKLKANKLLPEDNGKKLMLEQK